MWFLPSLGRPESIRKHVVDAYEWGGVNVTLILYEKDPRRKEYEKQSWPKGWRIEVCPLLFNSPTLNWAFQKFPNEKAYGFIADDTTPHVPGMLELLEAGAGDWSLAYGNDGNFKEVLAMLCAIGGELMRAVGYFSPPEFVHGGGDSVWHDIAHDLRVLRYYPSLTYTHHYPQSSPDVDFDSTHMHTMNASKNAWLLFKNWREGGGRKEVFERVQPILAAKGYEPQGQPIVFIGA